jgi:hypothetical protein
MNVFPQLGAQLKCHIYYIKLSNEGVKSNNEISAN